MIKLIVHSNNIESCPQYLGCDGRLYFVVTVHGGSSHLSVCGFIIFWSQLALLGLYLYSCRLKMNVFAASCQTLNLYTKGASGHPNKIAPLTLPGFK